MSKIILMLIYLAHRPGAIVWDQDAQRFRIDRSALRDAETVANELGEKSGADINWTVVK